MLNRLTAHNFKSWKKLEIDFGSVTGLFGTNSSGKSSILQLLLLLKQTKNATDRSLILDFGGENQLVNLGGFDHLINRHNTENKLSWRLYWQLAKPLSINDASKKRTEVLVSSPHLAHYASVHKDEKSLVTGKIQYKLGDCVFGIAPKGEKKSSFELTSNTPEDQTFRFIRNKARAWALPGPLKTHLFPDQAKTYFQNSDFLSSFETEYETLMDSIFYLGPLREHPRREYRWSGVRPGDVGLRGERTIEAILAATLRGEKRNLGARTKLRSFQEIIAHWLKELGLIYNFKVEEISPNANLYQTVVQKTAKSPSALLTDVGFGVSQVLPALVLLYYVPEGSIVLMEQPEIHLHPAVQSGLADIILNVAKTRKLQVVVESHSEHLLRRLQRRVAEETYSAEDLKLYFCDSPGGESYLTNLELDAFGEISNWPDNFFGDEFAEIAATRKAILKRKIKESS